MHKKVFNADELFAYSERDLVVCYNIDGEILSVTLFNTLLGDVNVDIAALARRNPSRFFYIQEKVNEGIRKATVNNDLA